MKAATILANGTVGLVAVDQPTIGSNEILVRMRRCGICGTDLEKVHGENITPPILGHEVTGEIAEVGDNVKTLSKGIRVAVHHHISCGSCYYCKNGLETLCSEYPKSNLDPSGFAEYFRVPEALVRGGTVYPLPDSVGFENGAQIEPTACCIRALNKAGIESGDEVVVFGLGPVGMTHIQLLKLYGASRAFGVDILENRRLMASKLGATRTFDPVGEDVQREILEETENRGVDWAIVATGNTKALEQAFESVRKGGKVLLFGAPPRGAMASLDVSRIFLREITFLSSYSTSETEMAIALRLIESRKFDPTVMVTHRFPLEAIAEAFRLAESGQAGKIIIQND